MKIDSTEEKLVKLVHFRDLFACEFSILYLLIYDIFIDTKAYSYRVLPISLLPTPNRTEINLLYVLDPLK